MQALWPSAIFNMSPHKTEDIFMKEQQANANERARMLLFKHIFEKEMHLDESHPRVQALKRFAMRADEEHIIGDVAECGVFRGNFAYHINNYFKCRQFYLCDTFSGFSDDDFKLDKDFDNSEEAMHKFFKAWSGTSAELVKSVMPYPEMCEFIIGHVPDSLLNYNFDDDQKFCFVSLDMDLYQPMYDALAFFWPRITGGGGRYFFMIILTHLG
jgi:hypothetical protein